MVWLWCSNLLTVLDWRTSHRHPDSGPSGAESDTERSDQDDDMVVKIGFRPNA